MEKEALYTHIEAYLANDLNSTGKAAFEQQMKQDASLKKEVELQQALAKTLGDTQKAAFIKNLKIVQAEMAQEQQDTPPQNDAQKNSSYWKVIGLAILAMLAIYGLYHLPKTTTDPSTLLTEQEADAGSPPPPAPILAETQQPKPQPPSSQQNQQRTITHDKTATAAPEPQKPPIKVTLNRKGAASSAEPKRRDGRSYFDVIPQIEPELTLAPDPVYSIESASVRLSEKRNQKSYDILFEGLLLTAREAPELALVLFDNRIPITEIKAVIPIQMKKMEQDPNIRAFAAKKTYELSVSYGIELDPGLYYLRLQRAGDLKTLWTSKLTVER